MKCEGDIHPLLSERGILVTEETPEEMRLKVSGEEQANELLTAILGQGIQIIKYELREPSLHEIFVEKVGGGHEDK